MTIQKKRRAYFLKSTGHRPALAGKMFADSTFNNEKCLNCKRLPLCYGPCIQKYYETKIGKSTFECLHDASEISLKEYVIDKVNKNLIHL